MDIGLSLLAIIVFLPLLLPIILLLRLTAEGQVFYKQDRIGYKNKVFKILKFATMLKNSPNIGTGSLTVRNDPRVTFLGKYLRKSKLNELPQVINVLMGDMSIVGPRPQMKVDFMCFPVHVQQHIYDCKPGITGIGSIIFRDEEKFLSETTLDPKVYYKNVIAPYKGEVELWYQKHKSVLVDIQLIFLTLWYVIFPKSNLIHSFYKSLPKFDS